MKFSNSFRFALVSSVMIALLACKNTRTGETGSVGSGLEPVQQCDDGDACTIDDRTDGSACAGTPISCASPPPAECVGSTLRTYETIGACNAGACEYTNTDTACPFGCGNSECLVSCGPGEWEKTTVAPNGNNSSFVLDAAGGAHVAYADARRNVWYAHAPAGGAWNTEDVGVQVFSLSLGLDAAGGVHLTYVDSSTALWNLAHAYRPTAAPWRESEIGSERDVEAPSLVVDRSGGLHVSYQDTTTGDLHYASRPASGEWATVIADRASGAPDFPYATSLVVDATGGVHIVYYDNTTANRNLRYVYRPAGGDWNPETVDSEGETGLEPSLAVDAANGVHISYYKESGRDLRYAYRAAGGAWITETVDDKGSKGRASAIAIDSAGGVHIAYNDETNGDVLHAYRRAGETSWAFDTIDADRASTPSLAIDAFDVLRVIYGAGDQGELRYAVFRKACP